MNLSPGFKQAVLKQLPNTTGRVLRTNQYLQNGTTQHHTVKMSISSRLTLAKYSFFPSEMKFNKTRATC